MSVVDIITIAVILVVFGISVIMGSFIWDNITDTETLKENVHANKTINQISKTMFAIDDWFPYIVILLFTVVLASAYFVYSHPIFLVFSMIVLGIGIFFSGIMVELFNMFARREVFDVTTAEFPIMVAFFQNLPAILIIMGAGVLIILYAKYRSGSGVPIQ